MKKLKLLIMGLLGLSLASCGGSTTSAFSEQIIKADLNAETSVVSVMLPKKERKGDSYKDTVQVKIRDLSFRLDTYTQEEESEELKLNHITTSALNLRKGETFVDIAYANAIQLDTLESGDSEKLNYGITEDELGKEYHKVSEDLSLALKFHINLEELDKVNGVDLKGCEKFRIILKDTTSSVYSFIGEAAHPYNIASYKWNSETSQFELLEIKDTEVLPSEEMDDEDEPETSESSEPSEPTEPSEPSEPSEPTEPEEPGEGE